MWRFCLVVIAVTYQCAGGETITPTDLKLMGGYRISRWDKWDNVSTPKNCIRSTGYPRGGVAVHTFGDGTVRVWHENGEQGKQVLSSVTTMPMGLIAESDPSKWPMMGEEKCWSRQDLFDISDWKKDHHSYMIPYGLGFDHINNRLWVSCRNRYATIPPPAQWISAIDYPNQSVNPNTPRNINLHCQIYGGGFGIIPKEFADAHLGGRQLGFIAGGSESGHGGTKGPALAAMRLKPTQTADTLKVFRFINQEVVDTDRDAPPYPTLEQVERAFPDYGPVGIGWAWPPRDTDGDGVVDEGYWACSSLRGGGTWIDDGEIQALVYLTTQATGEINYKLQVENLCETRANNMYIYDPADCIPILKGEKGEYSMRAKFYRWNSKVNQIGKDTIGRCACWDHGSKLLWIYYPRYWQPGDTPERYPIVAAYRIEKATLIPAASTGNQ